MSNYKANKAPDALFVKPLMDDISHFQDKRYDDNGKMFQQIQNQKFEPKVTFDEIAQEISSNVNNKEILRKLSILVRDTLYKNYEFYPNFVTSGFAKMIVDFLCNGNFIEKLIELTANLTSLENSNYADILFKMGIIDSLKIVIWNSEDEKVLCNTLITLFNISTLNVLYRNAVYYNIPLDHVLSLCLNKDIMAKVVIRFLGGLLKFDMEGNEIVILFPLIEKIFWKYREMHLIVILKLFIILAQSTYFLGYFGKKTENPENISKNSINDNRGNGNGNEGRCIVDEIISMSVASNPKILYYALIFSYKIQKQDFSRTEQMVKRYIALLGNNDLKVVYCACLLLRKAIKYEKSLIPLHSEMNIARLLMTNIEKDSFSAKKLYFDTLCMFTRICDRNTLLEILRHSFMMMMVEFLDSDDNFLISRVIEEISFLSHNESTTCGKAEMLEEFFGAGGLEAFRRLASGDDKALADDVSVIAKDFDINLFEE